MRVNDGQAARREPGRRSELFCRECSSARPGQRFVLQQFASKVVQPSGFNTHIVINEGENLPPCFGYARVQRVGFAPRRFEKITEAIWIQADKLLNDFACLVSGVIIDDEYFPSCRTRHFGSRNSLESAS